MLWNARRERRCINQVRYLVDHLARRRLASLSLSSLSSQLLQKQIWHKTRVILSEWHQPATCKQDINLYSSSCDFSPHSIPTHRLRCPILPSKEEICQIHILHYERVNQLRWKWKQFTFVAHKCELTTIFWWAREQRRNAARLVDSS